MSRFNTYSLLQRGTHFKRLRIDSDGDFEDEWPDGFFDERDEELF